MYDFLVEKINRLIYVPTEGMVHPGLSAGWVIVAVVAMLMISLSLSLLSPVMGGQIKSISLSQWPLVKRILNPVLTRPWILSALRVFTACVFLLVIYAGLFGTPIPERNIATVLTWTVWWSAVIASVFFVGSAWCAICPWDAISTWLVRRRLWKRGRIENSLNIRVPKIFRSVWPALFMFVALTWLELGAGVTTSPYATALMALLMVVLATVSLAVYERKAFCRYFCAVGRTIGAYSAMSPIALRSIDEQTCAECKTLECYYGTDDVEPCPTYLVLGRIEQNTYCTSCGTCAKSCPKENVSWRLRPVGDEIIRASRPHWDEAWFILGLLSLTLFHGFTMMPYWEGWMRQLAYVLGDSGQLLISFSVGMFVSMLIPVMLFVATIRLMRKLGNIQDEWQRIFSSLAFSLLPLAFSYHIAHNLTHLVRESRGFWSVALNPTGIDTLPLSMHEIHIRHMNPLVADNIIFALQALLVIFGFWLAVRIARYRVLQLTGETYRFQRALLPVLVFISLISLINLWLLMQPMIMRM